MIVLLCVKKDKDIVPKTFTENSASTRWKRHSKSKVFVAYIAHFNRNYRQFPANMACEGR